MRQNFDFDVDMTHLRYANVKTMFDGCKISAVQSNLEARNTNKSKKKNS